MSDYTRFVKKTYETLKKNNMTPKNIISFISQNSLWLGNYNDSVKKLSNYIVKQNIPDYQDLLKKADRVKEGMQKSNETVANAERRIQEKRLQEMELDLIADLNKENQKKLSNRGKYKITDPSIVLESEMNKYLNESSIPIDPALIRLLDKKNNNDDKKETKDDKEECPHCDCPFGEYNKCKGNKDRPDDYMFEKTKDGKKVDLGKTIVNVYCGATNSSSVPREIATSALEINRAPQSVKQRIAEQLGETIKSLDTKEPEKKKWTVPIAKKRAMEELSQEEKDELRRVRELKEQELAQAELKKAKEKTGNYQELPRKKVSVPENVQNMLVGLLGNKAAAAARQKEEERKKQAQSLPVLPDVPPPIPTGSGYYRKKRKSRKVKK